MTLKREVWESAEKMAVRNVNLYDVYMEQHEAALLSLLPVSNEQLQESFGLLTDPRPILKDWRLTMIALEMNQRMQDGRVKFDGLLVHEKCLVDNKSL